MSSIDLNIIQRGTSADFNWSAEYGYITAADMVKISEQRTDRGSSLNALPTPFARFFVFKEAFRRVLEHRNDPNQAPAGEAYERLVSNCLDVYELLYNLQYHKNHWKDQNRRIVIKEWKLEEHLPSLINNVPILGNAIECYYKDDLGTDIDVLYFIVLEDNKREYLLGTSSPYTGFITPPDLDKLDKVGKSKDGKNDKIFVGENYDNLYLNPLKRKNKKGTYFSDIVLFENRDKDFKNFMYNMMFGNGSNIDRRFTEIRNYIQSFNSDKDIKSNWSHSNLNRVISDDNNDVIINGLPIYYNTDDDTVNYFSDILVKVPYRISSDNYVTLGYINDKTGRNYDYILPVTQEGIIALNTTNIECLCKESKNGNTVDIILKNKGKEYSKKYSLDENTIISLGTANINFDMALFPNILSSITDENNYFKLIVSTKDNNNIRKTFTPDGLEFSFYNIIDNKLQLIETAIGDGYNSGVKPRVIRSKQENSNDSCNTLYYELFNTEFRVISSSIRFDKYNCEFAIVPKWREAKHSDKAFVYAIDLGTSNTYISRCEKGEMKEPQQLVMDKEFVSYFHEKLESNNRSQIACWEENIPSDFKKHLKTEFLPPYIDGALYKFPIRTALCMTGNDNPILFDNSNIAFFYEKYRGLENQRYITDIKWSEENEYLEVFIRELLLIIKADILQENGKLSETNIIWFRPLSFKNSVKELFEKLWKKLSKEILNLQDSNSQIKCYTESEAPYYYFNKKGILKSIESVAVMDIGGGSTDFVYYTNGLPQLANSIHFGCDVIWGNGYNKFKNAKVNGIYNHYKDIIKFKNNEELNKLYSDMKDSEHTTTRDIINFWISNDSECNISKMIKNDHLAVFAYHYTSLIYYMASMFKVNKLSYPRTIVFSGNGSKYIDNYIDPNISVLTEMTSLIIAKVYGKDRIDDIQLILPEHRKESTCYGGLYYKDTSSSPKQVIYMGDGTNTEYDNVKMLKKAFYDNLNESIGLEIGKMHQIYEAVLRFLISKNNGLSIPIDKMINAVNLQMKDSLKTTFLTEVDDKYTDDEIFNDTLFFMPIVQSLFNLTNVNK